MFFLVLCAFTQFLILVSAFPDLAKRAATVYQPGGQFVYIGCFKDLVATKIRSLPVQLADSQTQTVSRCLASCASQGYSYGGLEIGM
jgi:WSC domain